MLDERVGLIIEIDSLNFIGAGIKVLEVSESSAVLFLFEVDVLNDIKR